VPNLSAVSERGFLLTGHFALWQFFLIQTGFKRNRLGLPLLYSRCLEGPCLSPCQLTSYCTHLSSEDTISFKTALLCSASVSAHRCNVIRAESHCRESVFFSCDTETNVWSPDESGLFYGSLLLPRPLDPEHFVCSICSFL
jgi:hypothetical protein